MLQLIDPFLRCVKADFIKIKHSKAVWISLLGPLTINVLYVVIYLNNLEMFISKEGINPWSRFCFEQWNKTALLLLPFYIVLINSLVIHIEHKSEAWKSILVLPVYPVITYLSRFTVIFILMLMSILFFTIMQLVSGVFLGIMNKSFGFLNYSPDYLLYFLIAGKMIIASMGLCAFQYVLSLRYKNYVIPIGVGIIGTIVGVIIWYGWRHINYYFFIHPFLTIMNYSSEIMKHEIIGFLYFIIFLVVGFFQYKKLGDY